MCFYTCCTLSRICPPCGKGSAWKWPKVQLSRSWTRRRGVKEEVVGGEAGGGHNFMLLCVARLSLRSSATITIYAHSLRFPPPPLYPPLSHSHSLAMSVSLAHTHTLKLPGGNFMSIVEQHLKVKQTLPVPATATAHATHTLPQQPYKDQCKDECKDDDNSTLCHMWAGVPHSLSSLSLSLSVCLCVCVLIVYATCCIVVLLLFLIHTHTHTLHSHAQT